MYRKKTTAEFIQQAKEVHGERYDYSETVYKTNNSKLKIICLKHGSFSQRASDHLRGKKCAKCSGNVKLTTVQFIKRSKKIHNNYYDYSKSKYTGAHNKIKITCPKHGEFFQRPNSHLRGKGCIKCSRGNISKIEIKWLNSLKVPQEHRQYTIIINNNKYVVDGFDPKTNTVYEFNGDYWHGNPHVFEFTKLNKSAKKTFGQLYKETLEKEKNLQKAGYNVVSIWESDWKKKSKA